MTTPCVFVVDDDPDIREVVHLVLEARGYRVVEAADGAEALTRLAGEDDCRVILLDLMMPGMNGWEFRAAQRKAPRLARIPVLVLSGMRELNAQTSEIDASAVLQKPVDLEQLLREVEQRAQPDGQPSSRFS
jgi:CheY-like chemotaxis protein